MAFGNEVIAVVEAGKLPAGLMEFRLDHVAFQVRNVDEAAKRFRARGAEYCKTFTPDGPLVISEFWESGIRYVFFNGPGGWPFEFCRKLGLDHDIGSEGHGHYSIRVSDINAVEARLKELGAKSIASYRLGEQDVVDVRFMQVGDDTFEILNEAPFPDPPESHGWIGLLPR